MMVIFCLLIFAVAMFFGWNSWGDALMAVMNGEQLHSYRHASFAGLCLAIAVIFIRMAITDRG